MTAYTSDTLKQLAKAAKKSLASSLDPAALEAWRIEYLGRQGKIPQLLRQIKELPAEKRRVIGQAANNLRQELEQAYSEQQQAVEDNSHSPETTNYKLPALQSEAHPTGRQTTNSKGHLHPLTQSLRRAQEIFAALGFQFVEGPNIETAQYNFDNLNISPEHPSRAETDTFYLKDFPNLVLRTHVSTLQSRGVAEHNLTPPFKIFYYGPTFRSEKEDATHGSVFHQYEFMVVDANVNLADLKAIVQTFFSLFFGKEMDIRFRPGFFPFVEPGLEVDMRNKVTKKGGWLEMAGAGMVHPTVLKNIGVDPTKYQGIALGGGLDRLTMLKHNIPDIRLLYSGNTRFLSQF